MRAIFQKAGSKKQTSAQTLGVWGEDIAANYLRTLGYTIITRHWTARAAEIDIIARDGNEYVFVEVKTRSSRVYGLPEESVSGAKMRHLFRSVHLYRLKHHIMNMPFRMDVVAIEKDLTTGTHELRHLKAVL